MSRNAATDGEYISAVSAFVPTFCFAVKLLIYTDSVCTFVQVLQNLGERQNPSHYLTLPRGSVVCARCPEWKSKWCMAMCATGTDLSESNIAKSNRFAAKSGLPQYSHVLHPRTRGWCVNAPCNARRWAHLFLCIPDEDNAIDSTPHAYVSRWLFYDGMKEGLDAVYDVTIGYVEHTPGKRTTRKFLFNGRAPRQLHMTVKRYPVADLKVEPSASIYLQFLTHVQSQAFHQCNDQSQFENEEAAARWCKERFAEKEAMLKRFDNLASGLKPGESPSTTAIEVPSTRQGIGHSSSHTHICLPTRSIKRSYIHAVTPSLPTSLPTYEPTRTYNSPSLPPSHPPRPSWALGGLPSARPSPRDSAWACWTSR